MLRIALEVLVGLALASPLTWQVVQPAAAIGVALVVALRLAALRRAPEAASRWEASFAACAAVAFATFASAEIAGAMGYGRFTRADGVAWMFAPWIVAAYVLVVRPAAGLALASAWLLSFRSLLLACEPILLLLPIATLVLAAQNRRWRLPLTWACAGLAVFLACECIAFDRFSFGRIGVLSRHSWDGLAGVRTDLALAAGTLIAARSVLAGRTWGMFALVLACAAVGLLPAPEVTPHGGCMSALGHPLDVHQSHLFTGIAITLAITWASPVVRALRAAR